MKTHENRALFSRALLKATTCLFLTAGIGISAAYGQFRKPCTISHGNSSTKSTPSAVGLPIPAGNLSSEPALW